MKLPFSEVAFFNFRITQFNNKSDIMERDWALELETSNIQFLHYQRCVRLAQHISYHGVFI